MGRGFLQVRHWSKGYIHYQWTMGAALQKRVADSTTQPPIYTYIKPHPTEGYRNMSIWAFKLRGSNLSYNEFICKPFALNCPQPFASGALNLLYLYDTASQKLLSAESVCAWQKHVDTCGNKRAITGDLVATRCSWTCTVLGNWRLWDCKPVWQVSNLWTERSWTMCDIFSSSEIKGKVSHKFRPGT